MSLAFALRWSPAETGTVEQVTRSRPLLVAGFLHGRIDRFANYVCGDIATTERRRNLGIIWGFTMWADLVISATQKAGLC
jgi:hypothetical protein